MIPTHKILKLLLFLFLQLFQLPELLFPEVVLVVESLVLVVTVDDLRGCGGHHDAVDLEFAGSLPGLLLQVHFLDVVPRERRLSLDGRADDALLLLRVDLLLPLPLLLVLDVVVVVVLRHRRLSGGGAKNRNDRGFEVLTVLGAVRIRRQPPPASHQDAFVVDVGVGLQFSVQFEVLVSKSGVFRNCPPRFPDLLLLGLIRVRPVVMVRVMMLVTLFVFASQLCRHVVVMRLDLTGNSLRGVTLAMT